MAATSSSSSMFADMEQELTTLQNKADVINQDPCKGGPIDIQDIWPDEHESDSDDSDSDLDEDPEPVIFRDDSTSWQVTIRADKHGKPYTATDFKSKEISEEMPKTNAEWENVLGRTFMDMSNIEMSDPYILREKRLPKETFEYLQSCEQNFLTGKVGIKLILFPAPFAKCYTVGCSSTHAAVVIVPKIDKKIGKMDESLQQLWTLRIDGDNIVTSADEPDHPSLHHPKWQCIMSLHGVVSCALQDSHANFLMFTDAAMTQWLVYVVSMETGKTVYEIHFPLLGKNKKGRTADSVKRMPMFFDANAKYCVIATTDGGLYGIDKSTEVVSLLETFTGTDKLTSLSLMHEDDYGNSPLIVFGTQSGHVGYMQMVSDNIPQQTAKISLWWDPQKDLEQQLKSGIRCLSKPVEPVDSVWQRGCYFAQQSQHNATFFCSPQQKENKHRRRLLQFRDLGSFVSLQAFGNVLVVHETNNNIRFYNIVTGRQSALLRHEQLCLNLPNCSVLYPSLQVFSQRVITLLPGGNVLFILAFKSKSNNVQEIEISSSLNHSLYSSFASASKN